MNSGFSTKQVWFLFKMSSIFLLATVSLTVTAQQYDVGIDFRSTQNYVTDPAYAVFDNCLNDGITPQTRTNSNGYSVTWQWSQKCNAATDESNSVDPRLAGIANLFSASFSGETLTITLPQPGTYNIGFATGNAAGNQCGGGHCPNFIFRDGASGTQLFTVNPNNPGAGHFIDAANNNWTAAQWPSSNQEQPVTLTGTTLTVSIASGNAPSIAHIRITYVQPQPSFTLSASPASLSIAQGNQGISTITTAISGGFNSSISLSASGVPTGTTVSFNPQTIPAPGAGKSTMTIAVGSSTPVGTYPITVTGTGGGIQQTTAFTLTVTAGAQPNFTLSASPPSLSIAQGNQGTSTITTAISGGFNSSIGLSASGVPSGTTVSFNPQTIPAPGAGSSTMTITVGSSTPVGTYPITVTGNGGGIQQTTAFTLTVTAGAQPNFTISASPSSLSIAQGNQGTSTITITISGGFNSAIGLSASGVPTGTTVSFSPQTILPPGAGRSTMTITVGATSVGTYPITVTGNGGGIQRNTTATLTVTTAANFTLSALPPSLSIQQGNQGNSTITATISGGFNSAIGLSASGVPAGTTVSFNPNPIPAPGSGSSTMTITVGSGTPTGTYPIAVMGNGGGIKQTAIITLAVTAPGQPGFTLSASPASLSIAQGNQGTSEITTTISGGFDSSISLSASGVPTGTTVSFNPGTISAPGAGNSSMMVTVGSNTPLGTYPITVTASGGGLLQTVTMTLTVPAAGFTLAASPSSLSLAQSGRGTATITTRINGFNSSISLSASGAPVGVSIGFNPSTISAPGVGNSTMTIAVFRLTLVGTYPITVTATGGGTKQTVMVTLTITPQGQPNFTLSASPAALSIVQGTQATSSITSAISGGFNSSISLSASGMPTGTTASLDSGTVGAPGTGNSVMTITVNNGAQAGTYPVTVTGNGGGIKQTVTVTLTVTPAGAQGLTNANFMQSYSYILQASFGTPPYSYQVVSGSLPPGLTMDPHGNITGTPTAVGQFSFSVRATDSSQPPQQHVFNYALNAIIELDAYGGLTAAPVPGCTQTGFFQVIKANGRWVFATPNCNAFYQRSVYDADRLFILQQIMQSRYNNNTALWATHSLQRMTGWGFNSTDIYYSLYMLPVGTGNNPGASIKVPFTFYYPLLKDVLLAYQSLGLPEPVKDICQGFDGNGYYHYCSNLIDVFDPKYQTANNNELTIQENLYTNGFANDPWITAVSLGDSDFVFAIKGNGAGTQGAATSPHAGMMIATVNFQYSGFQDNTLYSKYAWVSYLQNKYGNIAALNASWSTGGFYTAFGDAGGFGSGTGVLDEDGRHTGWFGSDLQNRYTTLVGVNPNLVADMDAFLYQYTYQVYAVQASTVRGYDPNHLLLCGTFGGVGEGGTRPPVLQALKDAGCNIIGGNWNSYHPAVALTGNQAEYDAVGLPAVLWYGITAQEDSDVSNYPLGGSAFADYPSQLTRAQQYSRDQQEIFAAQGSNGDYYLLGTSFWSLTDNSSEETNWGLISFSDNAYDGRCAVINQGTDQYGYPCGGEVGDYGDFLDSVTQANTNTMEQLILQLLQ